ncbi:MAG: prolyl oligopeptidase family serine peptidase [Alphaproteobacteria bacterium]
MSQAPLLSGPSAAPAAGGKARELVILLHGVGADGNDLIGLAPYWAEQLPHAAFVSPNAPFRYDMAPFGYQWFSLADRNPEALYAGVCRAAPLLDAFIDAELARWGLTDDRLALVGFSQGTMAALHVGLRRGAPCAAIVGFSGALLGASALLAEIRCRPPVLLVHGDEDPVVPVTAMPHAVAALSAAGVEVESHVRPGLGHGIDPVGLRLGGEFLARAFAP